MYILKGKGGAIMRSLEQCQSIVIGSRKDRNFSIAKEILVCVLFFCLFSFLSLFYREDLQVSTITLSYYWDIFLALHTTDAATRASSFQKVRSWVVKSCYYSILFVLVWRIFASKWVGILWLHNANYFEQFHGEVMLGHLNIASYKPRAGMIFEFFVKLELNCIQNP